MIAIDVHPVVTKLAALVRDRSAFLNALRTVGGRLGHFLPAPLLLFPPLEILAHRRREPVAPLRRRPVSVFPLLVHRSKPTCIHPARVAFTSAPRGAIARQAVRVHP